MEKQELIDVLKGVMETLDGTLSANHEVVLHDLKRRGNSVVKIINGHVSGRNIDAPLLTGPEHDQGFIGLLRQPTPGQSSHLITGYEASTAEGKALQSASMIYYDAQGEPDVAFCVNVDNEPQELLNRLRALLTPVASNTDALSSDPSQTEHTTEAIQAIIALHKLPGQKLTREQRRKVVTDAHCQGIFKLRGGLVLLAEAMGVTRFTVYNDLESLGLR